MPGMGDLKKYESTQKLKLPAPPKKTVGMGDLKVQENKQKTKGMGDLQKLEDKQSKEKKPGVATVIKPPAGPSFTPSPTTDYYKGSAPNKLPTIGSTQPAGAALGVAGLGGSSLPYFSPSEPKKQPYYEPPVPMTAAGLAQLGVAGAASAFSGTPNATDWTKEYYQRPGRITMADLNATERFVDLANKGEWMGLLTPNMIDIMGLSPAELAAYGYAPLANGSWIRLDVPLQQPVSGGGGGGGGGGWGGGGGGGGGGSDDYSWRYGMLQWRWP